MKCKARDRTRARSPTRSCAVRVDATNGARELRRARRASAPGYDRSKRSAQLKPAFKAGGTVTAGNSSGINDGAAALLLCEAETARRLGLAPMARFVALRVGRRCTRRHGAGSDPGHAQGADARAAIGVADLDLVEINEAFAAQAIACMRELGFDPGKTNVNGGAIALGHPLGASGARIATTLLHELRAAADDTAWRRCASASGRASQRFSNAWSRRRANDDDDVDVAENATA